MCNRCFGFLHKYQKQATPQITDLTTKVNDDNNVSYSISQKYELKVLIQQNMQILECSRKCQDLDRFQNFVDDLLTTKAEPKRMIMYIIICQFQEHFSSYAMFYIQAWRDNVG